MTLAKNHQLLYEAVTNIDEKYLSEALSCKKKIIPMPIKRIAAVAATVLLILSLSYMWNASYYGPEDITLVDNSPFIITAGASNGNNKVKLPKYLERLLSSYSNGYEPVRPFGDHVLFNMILKPSDWQGPGLISKHFTLEIRYNGNVVSMTDQKEDKHIGVYFTKENETSVYSIIGWFEEPTEMTITFLDKETGTVIQEETILVVYDSVTQTYEFSVLKS